MQTLNKKTYKLVERAMINQNMFTFSLNSEILPNYDIKKKFYKMIKNAKAYKLIYRGSQNGFLPKNFKSNCGNIGHTITLCKIKGKNTE
jgi:hypothetical protein